MVKQLSNATRTRAENPLQRIHTDEMGLITPGSFPSNKVAGKNTEMEGYPKLIGYGYPDEVI